MNLSREEVEYKIRHHLRELKTDADWIEIGEYATKQPWWQDFKGTLNGRILCQMYGQLQVKMRKNKV